MKLELIQKTIETVIQMYYKHYNIYGIDRHDLYQVGQETYYKLYDKYGKQDPTDEEFTSWLRYNIGKYIEKNRPNNVVIIRNDVLDTDFVPDTLDNPETLNEVNQTWKRIDKGIMNLSERSRYILYSHHLGDNPKTVKQLASELNLSESRIYAILKDAQQYLREYLEK